MYTLYGDGIHDDAPAIQELIDSGKCEICLPAPEKNYLIKKTLILPSGFRLVLPRFAVIRLAPGADCAMVQNDTEFSPLSGVSPAKKDQPSSDIEITGGIWDCCNTEQSPNPIQAGGCKDDYTSFHGSGMVFCNMTGLKLSSMTIRNPSNYGVTMDGVSYFTVEDITFDYSTWNPKQINMDGIHLNGNCRFGVIRNLKGACFDDLVALNAYEGSRGPITDIEIDGIFAENCHSAVRLLCVTDNVERIHISNVYGSYYVYCIGVTKFYHSAEDTPGCYDGLFFDHIYASKAPLPEHYPRWPGMPVYATVWVDRNTKVRSMTVKDVHRTETAVPADLVTVGTGTVVEKLVLRDVTAESRIDEPFPILTNSGIIKKLIMENVSNPGNQIIAGNGKLDELC